MAAPTHAPRSRSLSSSAGVVFTLAALALGCGPSAPTITPAEVAARAAASIDVRLRGAWTLQTFRPETPLEPMMKGLVDLQLGRLVARFDGQRMVADSYGMHVDRAYRITEAQGDQFKLTTFDAQGVPYDALCTFRDENRIEISSVSPPWRGQAVITRGVPPAQPSPW